MKQLLGIAEIELETLIELGFTCIPSPCTHIIKSDRVEVLLLHASVDLGYMITEETPVPPDVKEKLELLAEHAIVRLYEHGR